MGSAKLQTTWVSLHVQWLEYQSIYRSEDGKADFPNQMFNPCSGRLDTILSGAMMGVIDKKNSMETRGIRNRKRRLTYQVVHSDIPTRAKVPISIRHAADYFNQISLRL